MAAKKGTTKKTTTTQASTEGTTEEQTTATEGTTEEQNTAPTEPATTEEQAPAETEATAPAEEEPAAEEPSFEVPDALQGLATRLNDYVLAMGPNQPLNADEIQTQQLKLRAVINSLLKTEDELFGDAMKHVVSVVRENRKGVFSERLIFRGFPQMKLARSERQRLEILVSLLLSTADAKTPSKVTDVVDMNVVFRYVTDNDQQQRLQSFYGM